MTDPFSDLVQTNEATTWFKKLLSLFVFLFSICVGGLAIWKVIDLIMLFVKR
jgi:hypothetical protein